MAYPQYTAIYTAFAVVGFAFIFATTALYAWRASRTSPSSALRRRRLFLTCLGALGAGTFVLVALLYAAYEYYSGYPCPLVTMLCPWGAFIVFFASAARAWRFIEESRDQAERSKLVSFGPANSKSSAGRRRVFHCGHLSDAQLSTICIGFFTLYQLIVLTISPSGAGFRNAQFGVQPTPENPDGFCPNGWELYGFYILLGVYLVVLLPYLLFKLTQTRKDTYGIRTETFVVLVGGVAGFVLYLVWFQIAATKPLAQQMTSFVFPIASFVLIHIVSVVVPVIEDLGRSYDRGPSLTRAGIPKEDEKVVEEGPIPRSRALDVASLVDFSRRFDTDPDWPAFRAYLVRCLCVENGFFMEEVEMLRRALDADEETDEVVRRLRAIYQAFIRPGAMMELQLPAKIMDPARMAFRDFAAGENEDEGVDLVVRSDPERPPSSVATLRQPPDGGEVDAEPLWMAVEGVWEEVVMVTYNDAYRKWIR